MIERTPSLSTSKTNVWNVVPGEEQPLRHRMIIYKTTRKMDILKEWGICKRNPLMWLTIWRPHIDSLLKNTYNKSLIIARKPKRSALFMQSALDTLSPNKRAKYVTEEDNDGDDILTVEPDSSPANFSILPES